MPRGGPLLIAHRAGRPENSIRACRASMRLGVDGIEIDVRRSRVGTYVVVHDPIGSARGLPTLDEFLPHATRGLVFLDIKQPYPPRDLMRIASKHLTADRLIFGSFWHPFIREFKRAYPKVRAAITIEARLIDPVAAARQAHADILAINDRFVDSDTLRSAHRAGLEVFPWTVNDAGEFRRLASLGADGIITDVPARMIH